MKTFFPYCVNFQDLVGLPSLSYLFESSSGCRLIKHDPRISIIPNSGIIKFAAVKKSKLVAVAICIVSAMMALMNARILAMIQVSRSSVDLPPILIPPLSEERN